METYLPVIWAGVIGTAVALYVILDSARAFCFRSRRQSASATR
jgi:hypothetical protein